MNIDWSNAPEGATHWDLGMNSRVAGWMKLDNGIWYWWPVKDAKCDMKWHASLNHHKIEIERFIARPSDWAGEGFPPVGLEVECTFDNWGYWLKGKVLCYGKKMIFMEQESSKGDGRFEGSMNPDGIKFRLIRTPEQIAAEERAKAIREMMDLATCRDTMADLCGELYDAGYRKQVQS